MWCAVHVKVFRGPLPSVLQVPSCLFLDMGGVSSASAGVYVSRQLLTAQLNLRGLKSDSGRIFMVLTWKSWPFSAHVWNPCWGKELCSFFFFFPAIFQLDGADLYVCPSDSAPSSISGCPAGLPADCSHAYLLICQSCNSLPLPLLPDRHHSPSSWPSIGDN